MASDVFPYRSSKQNEVTQVTPAELYFGRDLNLSLELLRGSLSLIRGYSKNPDNCVRDLREKLDKIH